LDYSLLQVVIEVQSKASSLHTNLDVKQYPLAVPFVIATRLP